jgi:hypothetical protein
MLREAQHKCLLALNAYILAGSFCINVSGTNEWPVISFYKTAVYENVAELI